jgi:C4-dicarboxylate-specific signal transduction histidine kinase
MRKEILWNDWLSDVSVQKKTDLQLQHQREEMPIEPRLADGRNAASFAHELNQPLTAIANNAPAAASFSPARAMTRRCCSSCCRTWWPTVNAPAK